MKYSTVTIALATIASANATAFSVCSGKSDGLGVTSVDFSEAPVVPGSTLEITVNATPKTTITSGAKLKFDIKLGSFVISSVSKDVCTELGVTCPLPAGVPISAKVDVSVSATAPAASVVAEVTTTSSSGAFVSCIDIPFSVASSFELPLTIGAEHVFTEEVVSTFFEAFKAKFNKVYEHAQEEAERKIHFSKSLKRVQAKNALLDEPNFGVTKFSDMSVEEFKSSMLTYKAPVAFNDVSRMNAPVVSAVERKLRGGKVFSSTATDKDWRDAGMVTSVKDQGQCGSCWAFSTTEGIESAYAIAGNKLTEFSVSQIVQCDSGDGGCRGGDLPSAYDYVQKAGGLALDSDYPYTGSITKGVTGSCNTAAEDKIYAGTNVKSWKYATPACTSATCNRQDEDTLANSVSAVGAPSVCVNAEPWQDYTTGVMKAAQCSGGYNDLDHCVQLIGFSGISGANGYWIVRNSWAADWGIDGMIHLAYGTNTCGIADEATLPTLA